MKPIPGPYIVAGQLFFRLCDGSSISCECIAERYAEEVVKACNSTELAQERDLYRSRWLSCVPREGAPYDFEHLTKDELRVLHGSALLWNRELSRRLDEASLLIQRAWAEMRNHKEPYWRIAADERQRLLDAMELFVTGTNER